MDPRAGAMEIASRSRDASAEAAMPTRYASEVYYVPTDPMDDLHCESCQ